MSFMNEQQNENYVEQQDGEEVSFLDELRETDGIIADLDRIKNGNESAKNIEILTARILASDETPTEGEVNSIRALGKATSTLYGIDSTAKELVSHESDSLHAKIKVSNEGAKELLARGAKAITALVTKLIHASKKLYIKIASKIRKFDKRIEKAKEIVNKASDKDITDVSLSDAKIKAVKKALVGLMIISDAEKLNGTDIAKITKTLVDTDVDTKKTLEDLIGAVKDSDTTTTSIANDVNTVISGANGRFGQDEIKKFLASGAKTKSLVQSGSTSAVSSFVVGNTNTGIVLMTTYKENSKQKVDTNVNQIDAKYIETIARIKDNEMPDKTALLALIDALDKLKTVKSSKIEEKISSVSDKLAKKLKDKMDDTTKIKELNELSAMIGALSVGVLKAAREAELTKYTNIGNVLALVEYYTGKVKSATKSNKKSGTNSDGEDNTPDYEELGL